jgi:Cytochrome C oxidase, cbb3-type, subunit III
MPIGLVTGALVLGFVAWLFLRPSLWPSARHCLILALLFLIPTALFGYMDWQHYYAGAWLFYIKMKLILSGVLLVLLSIGLIVTRKSEVNPVASLTIFSLSFFTVVALGYFGGQLVFGGWTPTAPKELQIGARIFKGNCSGCHPHGGNIIATNLPLNIAPQLADFDTFRAYVRHPEMPNGSTGEMPDFPPTKISDQQARELYQYIIKTMKTPKRQ